MKLCCARVPWKMSLNVRMLPLFFLEGYLCFLVAITFGSGAVKMKSLRKNAKLWLIEYYWMALQSNRYTKNVYHKIYQDLKLTIYQQANGEICNTFDAFLDPLYELHVSLGTFDCGPMLIACVESRF